ncbi:prepilin-type N-terminal cleavage/methylation domain-containing protein [Alkalihalobacillus macyae]|uniref:PulJ/GspJ family protein n=1 Tax=Guptibacillus hwajinpoensis TaxID=208199 RepID=UPI00273C41F3|nr:prepilin-type N-terminal cleavage/methylation domain-containing protein [Alkalihalobacillus macyae]MDP4550471.1 prepilin-type N-terminal cleavage/methylation domain-containing protein [Alkalihalobacillus macyae]
MIPYFHNNRGVTLPEVLITLVLLSIVSIAIYSFLFNGLHSYEKVKTETEFRDEADIVMTSFINKLYPVKAAEVTKRDFKPAEKTYLLTINNTTTIGFKDGKALLNGQALNDSNYDLTGSKITEPSVGQFKITIQITKPDVDFAKPLTLESQIGLITEVANAP